MNTGIENETTWAVVGDQVTCSECGEVFEATLSDLRWIRKENGKLTTSCPSCSDSH